MPKPLLSKAELDALMGLFESGNPETKGEAGRQRTELKGDVGALKTVFASEARRWSRALETQTGHAAKVTLRTIVRASGPVAETGEVCFRLGQKGRRLLICSEALVNLVNEKCLGAREEPPMVSHALSEIDRALFEACGAFFAEEGTLLSVENPPETAARIEARYDIEIAPLLRTTVRLVIDEKDV